VVLRGPQFEKHFLDLGRSSEEQLCTLESVAISRKVRQYTWSVDTARRSGVGYCKKCVTQ
jgi:hypothetical protein